MRMAAGNGLTTPVLTYHPKNQFCAVAGGAYDPGVVAARPAWREVRLLVARELGEPVYDARPLVPARQSGITWAARAHRTGPVVVKARHGDRADQKTQWCAAHLPALGAVSAVLDRLQATPGAQPNGPAYALEDVRHDRSGVRPVRSEE
jgi:hypothetical protein